MWCVQIASGVGMRMDDMIIMTVELSRDDLTSFPFVDLMFGPDLVLARSGLPAFVCRGRTPAFSRWCCSSPFVMFHSVTLWLLLSWLDFCFWERPFYCIQEPLLKKGVASGVATKTYPGCRVCATVPAWNNDSLKLWNLTFAVLTLWLWEVTLTLVPAASVL